MPYKFHTPKVSGDWKMNWQIIVVSTLNEYQADRLLFGFPRHVEKFARDLWYDYRSRDLYGIIDYPLDNPVEFMIPAKHIESLPVGGSVKDWRPESSPGQASMGLFLLEIAKIYKKIYEDPDQYGVWGHYFEDLYFEGVKVNRNGKVELTIGS